MPGKKPRTYIRVLKKGKLLGQQLNRETYIGCRDKGNGLWTGQTQEQAYKEIQHHVKDWIDNYLHFFKVRFLDDQHEMITRMGKCIDLRLFCVRQFPNGASILSDYLEGVVKKPTKKLWKWAKRAGVDVYAWGEVWGALCKLAGRLHSDVSSFYKSATNPKSRHEFHNDDFSVVSGTVIQKVVHTRTKYSADIAPFLHLYQLCVLKIANEAVVEGMCSIVDRHAEGQRGLHMEHYKWEGIVHWMMPAQDKCEQFLKDSLEMYSNKTQKDDKQVRFLSTDKSQRTLKSFVSLVVDRIVAEDSKFSFMTSKSSC